MPKNKEDLLKANKSPTTFNNSNGGKHINNKFIIAGVCALSFIIGLCLINIFINSGQNQIKVETKQDSSTGGENPDVQQMLAGLAQEQKKNKPILVLKEKNVSTKPVAVKAPVLSNYQRKLSEEEIAEAKQRKEMLRRAMISTTKLGGAKINIENVNRKEGLRPAPNFSEPIANTSIGEDDKDAKVQKFLDKKQPSGYLGRIKMKPLSPYEIKAGWVIPAILITGINSELSGQILAQISQNVYDTVSGKYLLIPQGTKAVGAYSSNVIYGQERLLVAWHKLIFPDGSTLDLQNMQGVSVEGLSGFKDQVNNHYFRIFASALLMSSISAGVALSDKSNAYAQNESNSQKAIAQAIQNLSQVSSAMIQKNMNIAPTIEIRAGYKFDIFVTKDILLEPIRTSK